MPNMAAVLNPRGTTSSVCAAEITLSDWIDQPARHAVALDRIDEPDGSYAPAGAVGEICDYLPHDGSAGYVVVDFPTTGPTLCTPTEIRPETRR